MVKAKKVQQKATKSQPKIKTSFCQNCKENLHEDFKKLFAVHKWMKRISYKTYKHNLIRFTFTIQKQKTEADCKSILRSFLKVNRDDKFI